MKKFYKLTKIFIDVIMVIIAILIPIVISSIPLLIFLQTGDAMIINWFILSLPIAIVSAIYTWPGGKTFGVISNYIEQEKILGEYLNGKWNEI